MRNKRTNLIQKDGKKQNLFCSIEASRHCKKKAKKRVRKSDRKSPYLICVSVLILLVRLDLRGLPVIRLFDMSLPPEGKPTSCVAVEKEKTKGCMFGGVMLAEERCKHLQTRG